MRKNLNVVGAKIKYNLKNSFFFSLEKNLPLTYGLIAPININTMRTFCLRSKFCDVNAFSSRSNTCWFATTYDTKKKLCALLEQSEEKEGGREKRRCACCTDRKSNSCVKMKKRRNKKLYTILFILIERGDG